ncbi:MULTISPECIES: hypothetical protein [Thalassotalea]|uniref:Swiss Army Knife 2H phosphoesterase domain-containing protein n=1 Tax=Thalassotalea castellviae TaxID=3075612 RepID=A0ABU2ZZQ9_9GAMM|nr:hypothetical protein [Thalassotalea sp. W431]MDT0602206.1 hypothetical protein [Thalassotalea sp. W431]
MTLVTQESHAAILQKAPNDSNGQAEIKNKPIHVRPGHARALRAIEQAKYQMDDIKMLVLEIQELSDSTGLKYLAGKVNKADIEQYLNKMQVILADEFDVYRRHQSARDHNSFHVTLVNPYEYQALADKKAIVNQKIRVQLHGLGRVSQGDNTAYFVVASSPDGQFLRQKLLLQNKDFHVTLGFKSQDVFGVAKDKTALIK